MSAAEAADRDAPAGAASILAEADAPYSSAADSPQATSPEVEAKLLKAPYLVK